MKLLLRYLRTDGQWVSEQTDQPVDERGQQCLDAVAGDVPDETFFDVDVICHAEHRGYGVAYGMTPPDAACLPVIDRLVVSIDGIRPRVSLLALTQWIASEYHEQLLDTCASC